MIIDECTEGRVTALQHVLTPLLILIMRTLHWLAIGKSEAVLFAACSAKIYIWYAASDTCQRHHNSWLSALLLCGVLCVVPGVSICPLCLSRVLLSLIKNGDPS